MKSKNSYRFTSDVEPSEKQLHIIMKEVAIEAQKRAEEANIKFQQNLIQLSVKTRNQFSVR
ncbi:MAG: hypothetical protein GZ094_13275 [Mariniphaga sp.]|nr:hypothetical protein [Mariniphaga sp.]